MRDGEAHRELEDAELVELSRRGDSRALELLFERHRDTVARIVFRMTGPGPDVEDLVQDVFLQVVRSLDGFRRRSSFSTWLYRVSVNVVLMHRRAVGRRPRLVEEELAPPAPAPQSSVEEAVDGRARVAAFYELLSGLSDKKRAVFVLHELEGLSPARIAEVVGAPVLTVRTRLFYARREVLARIAEHPELSRVLDELPSEVASQDGDAAPARRREAR